MDLLYISPEFPANFRLFVHRLKEAGVWVWGMGEADFFDMPEDLRAAMSWYVRTDLASPEAVDRSLDELLDAKARLGFRRTFDAVGCHSEPWLGVEARINTRLGVDGIQEVDLPRYKKKSEMKRVFREAGLGSAPGGRLRDAAHARELAMALGYPLILKPDEGVGAAGIHRVADGDALERVLPLLSGGYVMEAFVDAPIVSYDGLTDREGRILFENSLVYGDGVLAFAQGKDVFFYVNREIPDSLAEAGRRLVKAFDVRGRFFHFEFFALPDAYLPIEINCRPPGGPIMDMMNYSVDGDLYAAWAGVMAHGSAAVPEEKRYFCGYVGRRDRDYALAGSAALERLGGGLVEWGENPGIFQGAMGRWRYIFRSPHRAEIIGMAEALLALR